MLLGALLDAGAPADGLRDTVARLGLDAAALHVERVLRGGLTATKVTVDVAQDQPHRHLADILTLIDAAELAPAVRHRAAAVFERLADAEARVHGTRREAVHFHEVGAVDALVDIVGTCWALEALGVERVVCTPLPLGSGTVRCAHGVLPIPVPAVVELMKGFPVVESHAQGELTTPTGAAILTTLADAFGPVPSMTLHGAGTGAGTREDAAAPNVVRVLLGQAGHGDTDHDSVVTLETVIDDATPQVVGHTLDRLFEAGALDAWCMPIQMKKFRPGVMITVLAEPAAAGELEAILFSETTTFGIRRSVVERSTLPRRVERVGTRFGPIAVKIGMHGGKIVTVAPEYADCRRSAAKHHVALRDVMADAVAAWHRLHAD